MESPSVSFRGTGTQGTKQPYTKKLGQNFGAGISSQELCQDDIFDDVIIWTKLSMARTPGGGRGEGALGYFLGGYVPPGTPNWHPVLKKNPLKLIPRSRNGPIFYTPF